MASGKKDLFPLIDIALAAVKDIAIDNALKRVEEAQREYLIVAAETNRKKSSEVIRALKKLDTEKVRLQLEVNRLRGNLTPQAISSLQAVFDCLETKRAELVIEKNMIGKQINSLVNTTSSKENINGIPLMEGDILAVTRKGGLYQHFAVYIGNQRVIHYAAEGGDFTGKISIHEASYTEFKSDSTFVYVLDFPSEPGKPLHRDFSGEFEERENIFFELRREVGYHLYTPKETVERAKSRLGEEKYALPFNNCEHFAIWCKTGVKESHQVNVWLTRLSNFAKKRY